MRTPRDRPLRPLTDTRFTRIHQHPWENRKALSENYEDPVSGREGWWRTHIRETPKPGSYEHPTFIEEMSQRPNTYRFKSDGRKVDPHPHGKGAVLLPGAYESEDFLQSLDKKPTPATYSFKVADRDGFDVLNFGKKDKRVPGPGAYEKTFQFPIPQTVSKMGRQYGLFFTSAFQT